MKQCCDCRDEERENYDDDVLMTVIRDPYTNKLVKRGYMCGEHRAMYQNDGYDVIKK